VDVIFVWYSFWSWNRLFAVLRIDSALLQLHLQNGFSGGQSAEGNLSFEILLHIVKLHTLRHGHFQDLAILLVPALSANQSIGSLDGSE
jgi:hypothetical protein